MTFLVPYVYKLLISCVVALLIVLLLFFIIGEPVTFSDGSTKTVRCIVLCGSFDAPAKCLFQNMSQFNGAFGCPYCLHQGEVVKTSEKGHTRAYPFHLTQKEEVPVTHSTARTCEKRTHDQTLHFAKEAENLKGSSRVNAVKGVKGMIWSMFFPGFDIISGVAIDYMHCVLLGITKMLLTLWTDKSYSLKPWYLGSSNMKKLEERYLGIKPPNVITRTPRSLLKNLAHFKSSELRSFLLFYSVPCLWGLLEEEYFQHLLLLVNAIFLLLQDSISPNDIERSSLMLMHFCARMETLYEKRYETYNVHMLLHLPDCVRNLGPLWGTSCFWFEGYNGELTKLFHGTQNVDFQITHAVCIHQKIPELLPLLPAGSAAKSFYKHLVEGHALSSCREKIAEKMYAIGSLKRFDMNEQTKAVVQDLLGPVLSALKFKRLWKHGTMFQCVDYQATTRRNSYTVEFLIHGDLRFGEIQYFLKCLQPCALTAQCKTNCSCSKQKYIAILQLLEHDPKITLSKDKFTNAKVDHVVPIKREKGAFVAADVMDIVSMCVSVIISDCSHVSFVSRLPNKIEKD